MIGREQVIAGGRRPWIVLILCVLFISTVAAFVTAAKQTAPFIVLALIGLGWGALTFAVARRTLVRRAAFALCIFFLCVAETETYFYFVSRAWVLQYHISSAWQRRDPSSGLGDVTVPGAVAEQRAYHDGRLIYDAVYTIDPNGLRHIPADVQGGPLTVAFVGCSYMFGHGLNDNQTLPYYFLRDAHGAFRGYNFAVDDWGPHEILREIELGKMAAVVDRPNLVVYEAMSDHLIRTSGRNVFDPFGPKYVLCGDKSVCYQGPFHSAAYERLLWWLSKSWTFWYLQTQWMRHVRSSDLPLYLSIMIQIRDSVERNGGRFVVVFWDSWDQDDAIVSALRANRFEVLTVTTVIPDLRKNQVKHLLSRFDPHPTAEANQIMADYLFKQVAQDFRQPGRADLQVYQSKVPENSPQNREVSRDDKATVPGHR